MIHQGIQKIKISRLVYSLSLLSACASVLLYEHDKQYSNTTSVSCFNRELIKDRHASATRACACARTAQRTSLLELGEGWLACLEIEVVERILKS